jgi:nucleoside 2-deoxyribosyltransferase
MTQRHRAPRVYLAGRFARRSELRFAAEELARDGFEIASSWLFQDASIPGGIIGSEGRAAEVAEMDFEDIRRADVCIAFTEPADGPQGRGGRHVELGVALALGQRVVIVGPREHLFHCLPDVRHFDDWPAARDGLVAYQRPSDRELAAA